MQEPGAAFEYFQLAIDRTWPGGEPERIAVQGGFAEVSEAGLTVLAESAEV